MTILQRTNPARNNPVIDALIRLGVVQPDRCSPFELRCRDADIMSWRCGESGVIFLDETSRTSGAYYESFGQEHSEPEGHSAAQLILDDRRRMEQFAPRLTNSRMVDVGAGRGGFMDLAQNHCKAVVAVEPNLFHRARMSARGHRTYPSFRDLSEAETEPFDVATLFHVFEHLHDPVALLNEIRTRLSDTGLVIVEVPHAADALLTRYESSSFRSFSMWSEHLVLHTHESLEALLTEAGYTVVERINFQRYSLANHLYWLAKDLPAGQHIWTDLVDQRLDAEYERLLSSLGHTDTIIAIATPNHKALTK